MAKVLACLMLVACLYVLADDVNGRYVHTKRDKGKCPQVDCPVCPGRRYEYPTDENGCSYCTCAAVPCPQVDCPVCPGGYIYPTDENGCGYCTCAVMQCPQVDCPICGVPNLPSRGYAYVTDVNGCSYCTCA